MKETVRTCHESNSAPIFTQKSLTDIYNEKQVHHGASKEFTKKTHCTHLREKIMMEVPGRCDARDGRQVTLSIDDDIGRALFKACESTAEAQRYAHQVTMAALHTLTMDAFKRQTEFSNYSDWRQNLENESVTAKFWFTVIYMQVLLFMFVRSLRDSNFALFIQCFEEMLTWLAALDHVNYLRWGSVFLNDMKHLPVEIFK